MTATPPDQTASPRSNGRVALVCAGIVTGMIGLSYASVPLYRIFCQVTGFGGTTQRAEAGPVPVLARTMTIAFDANISKDLDWQFAPVQRKLTVRLGAQTMAYFSATNTSDKTVTGSAVFNVSPPAAGAYFTKVQCFCFTEQTLKPGQSVQMPVLFYVDPDLAGDKDLKYLKTITLSYTFYPAEKTGPSGVVN